MGFSGGVVRELSILPRLPPPKAEVQCVAADDPSIRQRDADPAPR